jgi:hypothetical protein
MKKVDSAEPLRSVDAVYAIDDFAGLRDRSGGNEIR